MTTHEHERLREITDDATGWRRWGPYLSDRAWATVREDYSANGDAWDYLPHDLARSKAYRWGEDGIFGVCDRYQLLATALAFWNGHDPILKERFFGLTSFEGNHGEDVKEYYYYVDNTPTHSYMRAVYKYPQNEYPYAQLVRENADKTAYDPEYELIDTGIFDEQRYFDIEVEFAKASTEDICIRVTIHNRGPDPATIHVLPHLWYRNFWSWTEDDLPRPRIERGSDRSGALSLIANDPPMRLIDRIPETYVVGPRALYAQAGGEALFTDNETNMPRVFGEGSVSRSRHVKDAFHRMVVHGEDATNPDGIGTKAAIHYVLRDIPAGSSSVIRYRLTNQTTLASPLDDVDAIVALRREEADEFYEALHPPGLSTDERLVQRQAWAGLLWSKQSYIFDVNLWLEGDNLANPPPATRKHVRNQHWRHLNSLRIMTLPDKWEYPWFAAWDLAFQSVAIAVIDGDFAKNQLWLLLFEQFQHPNGQLPAYEWEFSDLNPPVHAWAVWRVYNMDRIRSGKADRDFLERCFHKLLMNFAWWINKVDREGNNIFEGGFLGLDNITVVDRSARNAAGAVLEQSDATGWMGMFCLNLMRIALELAIENRVYESMATKFFQHYTYVADAMKNMGNRDYQLWDDKDGFFYDVLRHPDRTYNKFRIRSLVGLIPLFAVERLEEKWIEPFTEFRANFDWFMRHRFEHVRDVVHTVNRDGEITHVLTILNQEQLQRITQRLRDSKEFLSEFGIRSLSRAHCQSPFELDGNVVRYEPGESAIKLKGGNSNWRGPIWFPTCFLMIESLRKLGTAFGSTLCVPPPDGETEVMPFHTLAQVIAERLTRIFLRDSAGRRPVFGGSEIFQTDEHWRDLILFYEYFNGDDGAGLGASHQTGWTALVSSLIDEWRR